MNKRLSSLAFMLALVGSGPVLLAEVDNVQDLDSLSSEVLEQLIEAEIDDAYDVLDSDESYPADQVERAILAALYDANDDELENDVDYHELQAEMQEVGTSVEAVVRWAVEGAALNSYRQESSPSRIVLARSTGDTPWNAGLGLLLLRNPRTDPDMAIERAGTVLKSNTKKVRRPNSSS